jgi:hypothetical protein
VVLVQIVGWVWAGSKCTLYEIVGQFWKRCWGQQPRQQQWKHRQQQSHLQQLFQQLLKQQGHLVQLRQ